MSANIYDFETGVIKISELEAQHAKSREELEQEAADYAALTATRGWERLSTWLADSVFQLKEQLVDAEEPKMITKIQQQIIASEKILFVVAQKVEMRRILEEERLAEGAPDGSRS